MPKLKDLRLFINILKQSVLIVCLFSCSLVIPKLSISQSKQVYKIAVYEKNCRQSLAQENKSYKYEIRNLFMRVDTGWTNYADSSSKEYYKVFKGMKYERIRGYCCGIGPVYDSTYHFLGIKNDLRFLKPRPPIPLTENYFSKQFTNNDLELIKKAAFLSNNVSFKQHAKLKRYLSSQVEKKMLLDSVKVYMKNLYTSNRSCLYVMYSPGDTSADYQFLDTVIKYEVTLTTMLFIDSVNSFIDSKGNKIITLLLPSDFRFNSVYPFNDECFREDNGFKYFNILCYLDSSGKITFLYDNLQYIDHGDFDNDGKDEFLFWYTSHHKDGYVMFYNDFKNVVERTWTYQ